MEPRASWLWKVDRGLVCLLGGGDPPTGWSGLFKKEKKVTQTKKQQYKPTKNARNASSAKQINK